MVERKSAGLSFLLQDCLELAKRYFHKTHPHQKNDALLKKVHTVEVHHRGLQHTALLLFAVNM
ncbi:hypothetical protein [uncultured Fretibacterium sp.]|uniref:hypothetical protein n=1 Tax=uncultured Fretibacterium sp. TaxID=1678694 RepID=UPI002637BABB|nr:hypothetical protein [uncultured Fretibacterium sp.]